MSDARLRAMEFELRRYGHEVRVIRRADLDEAMLLLASELDVLERIVAFLERDSDREIQAYRVRLRRARLTQAIKLLDSRTRVQES